MKFFARRTPHGARTRPLPRSGRLGGAFGALFAALGILLTLAGAATLLGRPAALGALNDSAVAAWALLAAGLLLLGFGIGLWRRSRRRRRLGEGLSLSPRLMKKRP